MRLFYQTVTICDNSRVDDEWIGYEGYDLDAAIAKRDYENARCDAHHHAEVRSYRLPDERDFDDLDPDEQSNLLCFYDTID